MRIAVDGMGGDGAPSSVIAGIALAAKRVPNLSFQIFGPEARLSTLVSRHKILQNRTQFVDTHEVIGPEVQPTKVLRSFKESSMRKALEAVAEKKADAVVSAGNTGAYMVLSKLILKTLPGVSRPAIVSQIPTEKGESVFLDLGGSISCTTRHLIEFAVMGTLFAKHILFRSNPTSALLNIGSEETKGPEEVKEAAVILRKIMPGFQGFIEGNNLFSGQADVIITDGFSGNIALKTAEGMGTFVLNALKKCLGHSWQGKLAYLIARPFLRTLRYQLDPRKYNGACWMGLSGIAVKSHGGADAFAFSHAIEMASDMVAMDIHNKIAQELQSLDLDVYFSQKTKKT